MGLLPQRSTSGNNLMSLFGGIVLKEFLSSHQEWHALIIGVAEGFCPWVSELPISRELKRQVIKEYHYYRIGMAIGFTGLIFALAGAVSLVISMIL